MIDDPMFVPLEPEKGLGAFEQIDFSPAVQEVTAGWQAEEEEENFIEFVPEAPHTKEPDGELKPISTEVSSLRQQIEQDLKESYLTEREKQVLYRIRTVQYEMRVSPTCPEIAKLFGISVARAKKLVSNLTKKGYVEWSKHKSWVHKRMLFPKKIKFPWDDVMQFPPDIFAPSIFAAGKYKRRDEINL